MANIQEREATFWTSPATYWDFFKFIVPMVILGVGWGTRLEINQARNDARFDASAIATLRQVETLVEIKRDIEAVKTLGNQHGEQLARLQTLVEIMKDKK